MTAFFTAITALFFVAAINDARAQDSTTNTNEYLVDPYLGSFGGSLFGDTSGSFGTLSFGGGGGLPLDGGGAFSSQATVTNTYTQQISQYNRLNNNSTNAGYYDSGGGTTLGFWNNGDNTSQGITGWKTFTVGSATNSGNRNLQIGDTFTITVNTRGVYYGSIGVSLNSGNNYSSADFTGRTNGSRIAIIQNGGNFGSGGGRGAWYAAASTSPNFSITPNSVAQDYVLYFTITSQNTADLRVTGNGGDTTLYNLFMNGTAGVNIDNFSIWLSDDRSLAWNDNSGGRGDTIWKQTTTVVNNGFVNLGYGLTSGTFTPGIVANGLEANSSSVVSTNSVNIGGNSGTAVVLTNANTYGGSTTVNSNATALAANSTAFGTNGAVTVSLGGRVQLSNGVTVSRALVLNGDGISASGALQNVSGNNTWSGGISNNSGARINSDTGLLTLSGNITNAASQSLYIGGAGNTTIGGTITGDLSSGNGALFKNGAGTLTLTNANTSLTGLVFLNGGWLAVTNGNAIADTGAVLLSNSATTTFAVLDNETIASLRGGGASATVNIASGKTLTIAESGSQTFAGVISNAGSLAKSGAGTLILSGANTYTGITTISNGVLSIAAENGLGGTPGAATTNQLTLNGGTLAVTTGFTGNANRGITFGSSGGTVDVASNQRLTQQGGLYGSGNLIKTGTGTLALTNTAGGYSGAITVSGGTLVANTSLTSASATVGNSAVLGGSGSLGAVTIQSGGRIAPGNSPGNLSVSSLIFDGGSGYNWELDNVAGTAGTNWDLVTVGSGSGTVTFNNTSGSKLTIYITGVGTGFSNTTSYSWKIIDAGTLSGFSADAFAFNYGTINGVSPTGAFSVSNSSGDLLLNYTAPSTIYDITVASGSQTQSEASGGAALLTGALATVNKLGAGTLVMTNTANDYTGVTTVKAGTLQVNTNVATSGNTVLGNASSAVVLGDTAAANAAVFNIGAAVQNDRGLSIVAGTGAADRIVSTTIGSGTATQAGTIVMSTNAIYSASSGGTLLVSGAISGTGSATISNSGTVVFSGNNSYSGTTTVNSGSTLIASNNSALGTTNGSTTVSSGGALALAGGITTSENLNISGTGISSGGALRNVNGANTNSGTITVAANATISADSGTTLQLNNIDNGATTRLLTFSNIGTVVMTGNFSNMDTTSTFYKLGSGSLVISNTSANTGGGQLQIGAGSVTLAAGTFSTNSGTGTRGVDFGLLPGGGGGSAEATALYVNSGVTLSNSIYVAAGGGARTLGTESTTGTATFNNEIYLDSTVRLTAASGGTALFSGNFINSGNLVKVGDGTVRLSGNNTIGDVTISNGVLAITNGSAIPSASLVTIDSGATLSVLSTENMGRIAGSGIITVASGQTLTNTITNSATFGGQFQGAGVIRKAGVGSLTLTGSTSNSISRFEHEEGVLLVGTNTGIASVYQVQFESPGTRTIAASGANNFTLSQSNNIFNNLILGEATGNTGKLTFAGGTYLGDELNSTRTLTVAANNNHEFSGTITGNRGIIKDGTGSLTLSGSNTFGNTFQLNEGTVLVGNNNAFGTGVLQVQYDIAGTKTIASATGAGYTITNNVNVFNDVTLGLAAGGTGTLNFSGTFYLGDEAGSNRVVTVAASTIQQVSGAVTGARGVVKQGAGTITLSGASTSTGGFYIDNGGLNLNGGSIAFSGIDIGGGVNGNAQAGNNATLRVSSGSFNQAIRINGETNASGVSGTRTIEFANASGTSTLSNSVTLEKNVSVDVSTANGALSGVVSGATFGLTKIGNGTLTLSGSSANTYSGATTVSAGVLNLNKTAGVNAIAGSVSVASGATLLISASNQVANTSAVSLSGGTIKRGSGVSEVFGNLNLTAGSFLDFGSGTAGNLTFGTYTPSSLLTVNSFFQGNSLVFGSNMSSYIASSSSGPYTGTYFSFDQGFNTSWDGSTFTITAIPEPSTYVAAAGLLAMLIWPSRRRLIKDAKSILGLRAPARERLGR